MHKKFRKYVGLYKYTRAVTVNYLMNLECLKKMFNRYLLSMFKNLDF